MIDLLHLAHLAVQKALDASQPQKEARAHLTSPMHVPLHVQANKCTPAVARLAIDATAGNGHDTVFLAQSVGEAGHVYAFDIQAQAITATQKRLEEHGLAGRVTTFLSGHEHMAPLLPASVKGCISVAMCNLGYLPGSAKTVTTQAASTIQALEALQEYLAPAGLITIHSYSGMLKVRWKHPK